MTKKFKIGNLNMKLNFWHYWGEMGERWIHFRGHRLGLFHRKTVSIGSGKVGQGMKMFDDDNHVTTHTFGIELIWIKASIDITLRNIMIFGLK